MDQPVDAISTILLDHFTRYPQMQAQDLYKLLHQAALGSGHAVPDEEAAREWLQRELAEMGPGPDEPLIDPVSPDGRMARIHLRPWRQTGREPDVLLRAFLRTAQVWQGRQEILGEWGRVTTRLAGSGKIPLQQVEIASFFATMEAQGYPAVHHTSRFRDLYRPAYRVVHLPILEAA